MITGGWEPISLSSNNRLVYIASTGHGPVPLRISSAAHRIELTIFLTIMDDLPMISPPQRAKFEILTEIGVAPTENGGGTSATATASPLGETARVLLASPSTHPERRGSNLNATNRPSALWDAPVRSRFIIIT